MTVTLEARWFGSPPLPSALREWYDTLGSVSTTQQTDLYLPAEDAALNLKLRDDRFQIKRRVAGPRRTNLGPNAKARCEQWIKWSFPLRDGAPDSFATEEDPTELWVSVTKTRHQLSIPPEDQSSLTAELPTTPPATIDLELTTITAKDEEAWTFCMEAEGPVASLTTTLSKAAPRLLDDLPVPLPDDQSFGYSRWLHHHPTVSLRPTPDLQISRLE